jgi:hypothetical protein
VCGYDQLFDLLQQAVLFQGASDLDGAAETQPQQRMHTRLKITGGHFHFTSPGVA